MYKHVKWVSKTIIRPQLSQDNEHYEQLDHQRVLDC